MKNGTSGKWPWRRFRRALSLAGMTSAELAAWLEGKGYVYTPRAVRYWASAGSRGPNQPEAARILRVFIEEAGRG